MTTTRHIIAALLIALLGLTAQGAAVARAMPVAAGWAELCINGGPAMVAVDAEGQPTGAAHLCPDFATSLLDMADAYQPLVKAISLSATKVSGSVTLLSPALFAPSPAARGPCFGLIP